MAPEPCRGTAPVTAAGSENDSGMPSPSLGGWGTCRNDGEESAAAVDARCTTGADGSGTYVAAPSEVLPSVCLGWAGTDSCTCDTGETGAETGEPGDRPADCGGAASTCSTGKASGAAASREPPPGCRRPRSRPPAKRCPAGRRRVCRRRTRRAALSPAYRRACPGPVGRVAPEAATASSPPETQRSRRSPERDRRRRRR